MPELDQLLTQPSHAAFGNAQVWEARVTRVTDRGVFVVVPAYDRMLRWGPCLPESARAEIGDRVAIAFSERGRPWLIGQLGGGDGDGGGAPLVWQSLTPYYNAVYWQDWGGDWGARFAKDAQGVVRVGGLCRSVAAYAFANEASLRIATLPPDFCPTRPAMAMVNQQDSASGVSMIRCDVYPTGDLGLLAQAIGNTNGNALYLNLSSIWFPTEPEPEDGDDG